MEAETIDLTHPIEDMLKQRNWSPECINELISSENAGATKKGENITLNSLLYDYRSKVNNKFRLIPSVSSKKYFVNDDEQTSNLTLSDLLDKKSTTTIESLEIVELSDDDDDDDESVEIPNNIKEDNSCDTTDNITEVQVIDVSDFSDKDSCGSGRQNDDDDDSFQELSLNSTSPIPNENNATNLNTMTSSFLFVDCNGKSPDTEIDKSESCETESLSHEIMSSKSDEDKQDLCKLDNVEAENLERLNVLDATDCQATISVNSEEPTKNNHDDDSHTIHDVVPKVASIIESDSVNQQESVTIKSIKNNAPIETAVVENLEDIRKHLKLQLTNLRTRKKTDSILKDVQQTVNKLDKLQQYSNKVPEDTNILNKEETINEADIKINTLESEETLNNQLDKTDNADDSQEDENVPNVFNEIRKIIRKPKSTVDSTIDKLKKSYSEDTAPSDLPIVSDIIVKKNDFEDMSNEKPNDDNRGQVEPKNSNIVSSPFVSETLDEFLTDSKLNVSYTIPKSGAEEGLRMDYSVEPVVPFETTIKEETREKAKEELKYKPKTLAEKRRILEKTIRQQKRLAKLKSREELQKRSYVLFRNKKIFIHSNAISKCIASIESNVSDAPVAPSNVVKKPSLLTSFYQKSSSVKYKPGPLSKKHLLQTDYSQWVTEPRRLPKVILSIMPQLGKPVHPNLWPIVCQGNGEITDNQAEFALSALVTKTQHSPAVFGFDVPYEKRREILLVRKKITNNFDVKDERIVTDSNPDSDIAELLDNLIKYVEIKEIASSLIKEDEELIESTSTEIPCTSKSIMQQNQESIKKKSFRKLSRTSKELLRLNCKVVSMEVKENDPENNYCSKPHCRLGCICSSLECKSTLRLHCQKTKCIFGCLCPKENNKIISISVPTKIISGSENLSTDTVSRIEDEAKKNLAKVEREFTQTIIYTNDKTIVVGAGNKPRRAARAPKKYCDFFDEDDIKVHLANEKSRMKPCFVSLEKWDLSDIVPYCLVHDLYSCPCNGHSTLFSNMSIHDSVKEEKKPVVIRQKRRTDTTQSDEYDANGRPPRKKKPNYKTDYDYCDKIWLHPSNEPQAIENPVLTSENYCSRTCKVPKNYFTKKIITSATTCMDFCNNITEADILKMELKKNNDILDSDKLKMHIIEEKRQLCKTKEKDHRKRHQRKQQIQVRQDDYMYFKSIVAVKKPKRNLNSVFPGEIIVNDAEWIKKMCGNTKQQLDSYARILPWEALIKGFIAKSINVYCICDVPLRLLLNVGRKLTSSKILDIELAGHNILETPLKGRAPWLISQSENVRDIIKWLLSGTLPSKYKSSTPSFLLVETLPGRFEVRGICTQNVNNQLKRAKPASCTKESEISDEITEIKHKNMNNEVESLFITKQKFRLRELVEDGFDDDLTDNLYMWVGLPDVYKVAKWRVIFLKNDFVYLYFKTIRYSIKYSDLVKLTEIAKEENLTLLVRNLQIRRSYEHSLFGLYISPTYMDRIFIGPYFIKYDTDDIETLKFMNESLISSELFNRMKGSPNQQCGHWMYERPYNHTPKIFPKDTIDLTHEESSATRIIALSENKPVSPREPPINPGNSEHIIMHNGFPVYVKNSKPRSPADFNRYIITNIPHFGYLGAFQPENSAILEVSWPFERKVLQFQNADHARDFLQERFNQLLQPVPNTFKIQVIVLISLDLEEHQPINSDFLSGQCICGYFGTYNFKEVTDEFCRDVLKTTKEEIIKLFARRAQEFIKKKICDLAELTGVSPQDTANFNVGYILNKAREEIKWQEHSRIKHIAEIHSTERKVIHNIKKIFTNIKKLPVRERNIESRILNETVQIRPNRFRVNNEIIVIKDEEFLPASSTSETNETEKKQEDSTIQPDPLEIYSLTSSIRKESVVRTYKPKVAKVAPFSATPPLLVDKGNLKALDEPDCDEKSTLDNS